MLTLSHVSKSYGKFPAVEDISFEMEHGLYGMLAPNGAGKTTLIKMIATLLVPTQGEILWDGIPVAKLGEKYRDLLGYLPQQFGYYKNNTPVQYLDYLAALKNMSKQTAKEKIEQLLELVGLSDVADKKMKKFSGGMIQRVGIAQAIVHNPRFVVLDEPTNGLDPVQIVEVRHLIKEIAAERAVMLSTHILSEVQATCDKIKMIEHGHMIFSGTMEEFNNYVEPCSFLVTFGNPPAPEELKNIDGISEVEPLTLREYRVYFTAPAGITQQVIARSVEKGWQLEEICLERESLDTIFARLSKNSK